MNLPLVAVVGRPNVGKSTLVNRLARTGDAIVAAEAGVTRDRNYAQTEWGGKPFMIVDTGGLELGSGLPFAEQIKRQAMLAVDEADVIVMVVDGVVGLTAEDEHVGRVLKKSKKPVVVAVNKIDTHEKDDLRYPFFNLGMGEPRPVSALHGLGTGDVLDVVVSFLPLVEQLETPETKVAIVGRPNVGKSSIINALLGEERAIVSELPGTTRDAVDTLVSFEGDTYRLIDTAGVRRAAKVKEAVEYYGFVRAMKSIGRADIALVILDSADKLAQQDQRIVSLAESRGCGIVVAANKWDLVTNRERALEFEAHLANKLRFVQYAPVLKVSAVRGTGIDDIPRAIKHVASERSKTVSTPDLNNFAQEMRSEGHAPAKKGRILKLTYVTQVGINPPKFIFFVNDPRLAGEDFKRYLENRLRRRFGFEGTPVIILFRKKS